MPTQPHTNELKPIPLDYATPSRRGALPRRIFEAIGCVLVAIFSLPWLFNGFAFLMEPGSHRDMDIASGAGFVLVGIFCLWIAIRWALQVFLDRERWRNK